MKDIYEVVSRYPTGGVESWGEYKTIEEAEEVYQELLAASDNDYVVTLTKYVPSIIHSEIKKGGEDYEIDR